MVGHRTDEIDQDRGKNAIGQVVGTADSNHHPAECTGSAELGSKRRTEFDAQQTGSGPIQQMQRQVDTLIIGQGLAGSVLAWTLEEAGQSVFLIDADRPMTASKVAAGLITPVTGKRLVVAPDFLWYWKQAVVFYRRIEETTKRRFFSEQSMIRLSDQLPDEQTCSGVHLVPWTGSIGRSTARPGFTMSPAARLDVKAFLSETRSHFEQRDLYRTHTLDLSKLDLSSPTEIAIPELNLVAKRIVVATGAAVNAVFPDVPNNPARGDVLRVRIPGYNQSEIVHSGIWIVPEVDGSQLVGSTYDWKQIHPQPSRQGQEELTNRIRELTAETPEVVDHTAGVRPTMKDYQPVVGQHPQHKSVYVCNGLGSKGTLKAPALSAMLRDLIQHHSQPQPKFDYARLIRHQSAGRPLTQQAQQIVAEVVQPGDTAIDATVGNGFDTSFLAALVGPGGRVYGFDVQPAALDATTRRLAANNLSNVTLQQTSHDQMKAIVDHGRIAAVMFNLGYLPRSDHTITTTALTTLPAIEQAIELLRSGGILSVLCYRGHEGGQEEYKAVRGLLRWYGSRYDVDEIESEPPKPTSPVLFTLKKQSPKTGVMS